MGRGVDDCTADLQVPVIAGFLIECVLTCACRLVSRALGEIEPKFASAIDSFFATSMVVLGELNDRGKAIGNCKGARWSFRNMLGTCCLRFPSGYALWVLESGLMFLFIRRVLVV